MKTNRVDISREDLIGESLLLSLLGRVLYQYPDGEQRAWFQSLIDSDAFMEAPFAEDHQDVITGLEFLQAWRKRGLTDETFLDLQEDYSRLFIGPGKVIAPPWESVFFNEARQTFQEQTLQVRNWYRRFGLEPEKIYHEPDDHIGLELTFLAHLANQAFRSQTFQEQTLQVRNWYRRFGLEPEKIYHEPDDHIGLELTFLAHLANQAF